MKLIRFCTVIVLFIFSRHAAAQKKIEYIFPDDLPDSSKKTFVKQFYQGQVLYTLSCARCHKMVVNGKEVIPDFSLPQLMDYEMRLYPQHMEELNDTKVADDEMNRIILFLRYKKKSGVTVMPPPKL